MLFPIRCYTCGRVISKNLEQYFDELNIIIADQTKTKKQKEEAQSALIKKYNFDYECHSHRILGQLQWHKIIV